MIILLWIQEDTIMDSHRQGKKANAFKYPLTFKKPHLKNMHCPCRDNSIPQPVPLLINPASKLELPHVQTILLEQFKTVPPPSTISNGSPLNQVGRLTNYKNSLSWNSIKFEVHYLKM